MIKISFDRKTICVLLTIITVGVVVLWHSAANGDNSVSRSDDRSPSVDSSVNLIGENSTAERPAEEPPATKTVASPTPSKNENEDPAKWQSIADNTRLQFVSSNSLLLNKGVSDLLGLTPTQLAQLNEELRGFVDRLRAAEIKNAYVLVKDDGSEEIVVSPFDRGPLLKQFRDSVAARLGENVGDFCAKQMRYDSTLAVESAELRVYIEKSTGGLDNVVFERKIRRREADDPTPSSRPGKPKALTTVNYVNKTPLVAGQLNIRFRHLFNAESTLPRKTESAK